MRTLTCKKNSFFDQYLLFYIAILGMTCFSSDNLLFLISDWTVFLLFYLDFYFFFWTLVSFLDFYFFFGLLFPFLHK